MITSVKGACAFQIKLFTIEVGVNGLFKQMLLSFLFIVMIISSACTDNEAETPMENKNVNVEEPEAENNGNIAPEEEIKRLVVTSLNPELEVDDSEYTEKFDQLDVIVSDVNLSEEEKLGTFDFDGIVYNVANISLHEIEVTEEAQNEYSTNAAGNFLISYDVIAYNQKEQRERVFLPHLDVKINGHTFTNEGIIGPSILYTELRPEQAKVIRNHIMVAYPLENSESIDVGLGYEFRAENIVGQTPRVTIYGDAQEKVDYNTVIETNLATKFKDGYHNMLGSLEEDYELNFGETIFQHAEPLLFDEDNGIAIRVNRVEVMEVDTSENEEFGSSDGKVALLVDTTYLNKTDFPFEKQTEMVEFELGEGTYENKIVLLPYENENIIVDPGTLFYNRELIIFDMYKDNLQDITVKLSPYVMRQLSADDSEYVIYERE